MQRLTKLLSYIRANLLIVVIVTLAFVLRVQRLSFLPPSLNWDEVSHGYNAYSILKTGKDEWGVRLPTIFRAYGDYKLPVYIYLTAISESLFGINEAAVRLPSVLAGTASVLFTYLLVLELFRDKKLKIGDPSTLLRPSALRLRLEEMVSLPNYWKLAIVASFLLAVEPWSLFLSRITVEANLSLAFIISGTYFFLKGIKNSKFLIPASILFGLSVWTYNSARIFVPLLLLLLVFIYRDRLLALYKKSPTTIHLTLITAAALLLPMFWQLPSPTGLARYGWVAIIDEGAIAKINEARTMSNLPGVLPTMFHNKATFFAKTFLTNYFSHFSLKFLFLKGGTHYQFSIQEYGLLYLVNLPFFVIGLILVVYKIRSKNWNRVILLWLLLSPIASSLTREAPHVLRSIVMLPTPQVITAIGLLNTHSFLKKNSKSLSLLFIAIYAFILLFQVESYGKKALFEYRENYSWSWQYGYKQVVEYVKVNYDEFDRIIVSKKYGEPHEFFLFYWPWDPKSYQEDEHLIRFYQSDWYWVDRFDKFYFVNDWQIPTAYKEDFVLESGGKVECQMSNLPADKAGFKCLLITSPGNYPDGWNKIKTIYFLNGDPAFEILENPLRF